MTAAPATCRLCSRDPARMNSAVAECSVIDCPHRRRAWSEQAPEHFDRFSEAQPGRPLFEERDD